MRPRRRYTLTPSGAAPNGATAQRVAAVDRDPLDRYYTPPAVAACVVAAFAPLLPLPLDEATALEPSAGGGAFVRALVAAGALVDALDVDPSAACPGVRRSSFLASGPPGPLAPYDLVAGNPPFALADQFVAHALTVAPSVAFLLPVSYLGGRDRWAGVVGRAFAGAIVLSPRVSFEGPAAEAAAARRVERGRPAKGSAGMEYSVFLFGRWKRPAAASFLARAPAWR